MYVKSIVNQAKVYIRPLQRDLSLEEEMMPVEETLVVHFNNNRKQLILLRAIHSYCTQGEGVSCDSSFHHIVVFYSIIILLRPKKSF